MQRLFCKLFSATETHKQQEVSPWQRQRQWQHGFRSYEQQLQVSFMLKCDNFTLNKALISIDCDHFNHCRHCFLFISCIFFTSKTFCYFISQTFFATLSCMFEQIMHGVFCLEFMITIHFTITISIYFVFTSKQKISIPLYCSCSTFDDPRLYSYSNTEVDFPNRADLSASQLYSSSVHLF